jgi:hypothetical protein
VFVVSGVKVPVREMSWIVKIKADPGLDKAVGKYIMGRHRGCQGKRDLSHIGILKADLVLNSAAGTYIMGRD